MSVESEIDRLRAAKIGIREGALGKGVAIPAGAGLDEYPAYVEAIRPGSKWYTGTKVTGTNTTPTIFSSSGIADALADDCYLNTSTGYVYQCTEGGAASASKWKYTGSIKGTGGDNGVRGTGICMVSSASVLPTSSGGGPFKDTSGTSWETPSFPASGYPTCQVAITSSGDVYNYNGNGYSYVMTTKGKDGDPADVSKIPLATTSANGLMSAADKTKMNGIAAGANNYTHPATHPASIVAEDSTHRFVTDTEKTTWNAKAGTSLATTSTNGLMSSADKSKLNGLSAEGNTYVHPATHPASMIETDSTRKFVSNIETALWNNKADGDLSNVTLGKDLAGGTSGFYRAPDGLLIQWGVATVANGGSANPIYFPVSFYTVPISIVATLKDTSSLNGTPMLPATFCDVRGLFSIKLYDYPDPGSISAMSRYDVCWMAFGRWK